MVNAARCLRTTIAALLSLHPVAVAGGQVPEAATFYLVAGTDTLVVERMTRLPNRVQFQLFDMKRLGKVDLTAEVLPSAQISTVDVSFFTATRDTIPMQHSVVRFVGDSVGFQSGGE